MRTSAVATVVVATCIATSPAWARPIMSGKYTIAGTETCQIAPGVNKGKIIQHMGTITLTSTATGATGTYVQRAYRGSLADRTDPMAAKAQVIAVTITVSGTVNPYTYTVAAKVGTATTTQTGHLQLDGVVSNVAQRAVMVGIYKSGDTSTPDCNVLMTLTHQ